MSRKNCLRRPATLFTSWKKFAGSRKSTLEASIYRQSRFNGRHPRLTIVEHGLDLAHMRRSSGKAIYALYLKSEEIYSLYTLIDYHWYSGSISLEELLKAQTKHRVQWRQMSSI